MEQATVQERAIPQAVIEAIDYHEATLNAYKSGVVTYGAVSSSRGQLEAAIRRAGVQAVMERAIGPKIADALVQARAELATLGAIFAEDRLIDDATDSGRRIRAGFDGLSRQIRTLETIADGLTRKVPFKAFYRYELAEDRGMWVVRVKATGEQKYTSPHKATAQLVHDTFEQEAAHIWLEATHEANAEAMA